MVSSLQFCTVINEKQCSHKCLETATFHQEERLQDVKGWCRTINLNKGMGLSGKPHPRPRTETDPSQGETQRAQQGWDHANLSCNTDSNILQCRHHKKRGPDKASLKQTQWEPALVQLCWCPCLDQDWIALLLSTLPWDKSHQRSFWQSPTPNRLKMKTY